MSSSRVSLGSLVRGSRAETARLHREIASKIFPGQEEATKWAVEEELGPTWGIYKDDRGYWFYSPDDDAPLGFVSWCPPLPPPPPPPKWAGYCENCGSILQAGQLGCPECGWTGAGWED